MKNFFRFLRERPFAKNADLAQGLKTIRGKSRVALIVVATFAVIVGATLIIRINEHFSVRIPVPGGTITEGVVGIPRFINPVLAVSDTDRDMTALVYSGLMKRLPDGEIIPDLAESFTISSDGLTYTFTLKPELTFHDGSLLTTEDVFYTIAQIQNPIMGSPRRTSWAGITTQKIDDRTISFTLPKAFGPFLETATVGILPAHLWKDTTPETFNFLALNVEPIGSGPYQFSGIEKRRNGIPTAYTLTRFKQYALGAPYIEQITIHLYGNQEELARAVADTDVSSAAALSPEAVARIDNKKIKVYTAVLPRVFGIFLNQNKKNIFSDKALVALLDEAIDKETLVGNVFGAYARPVDGPVPFQPVISKETITTRSPEEIQEAFTKHGWEKNADGNLERKTTKEILSFSLATVDTPELTKVATAVRDSLTKYGITVELKIYDLSALSQNVIQPRQFDALLFGHAIENEADLYAFWHSSQRNYPGLNITQYANPRVDTILESILKTTDHETLDKNLALLDTAVRADHPAIFIYLPHFLYVAERDIGGITLDRISTPSDRFLGIQEWYKVTEPVWKIFIKD